MTKKLTIKVTRLHGHTGEEKNCGRCDEPLPFVTIDGAYADGVYVQIGPVIVGIVCKTCAKKLTHAQSRN